MQTDFQTKIITCIQCDCEFDHTIDEQMYYEQRGFDEPKRCPVCRKKKSQPTKKKMIKKRYYRNDL
jgi:hypothetical protein